MWGMEVNYHPFLTLAMERVAHSGCFTPQKNPRHILDIPLVRLHNWHRCDGRKKYPHPSLQLNLSNLTLYYYLLGT
jgi:hypothetical protein